MRYKQKEIGGIQNKKLEPMEQEKANEHMKIFEDAKTKTLPEELINATDPQFKHWVDNVLKDNKRFPCINPMTKFRTLEKERSCTSLHDLPYLAVTLKIVEGKFASLGVLYTEFV